MQDDEKVVEAAPMQMLDKASILAVKDLPNEVVPVPEWGGAVTVQTMTGAQRDAFEVSTLKFDGKGTVTGMNRDNMRARLCASTIVNVDGTRMFTMEEAAELGKKSAAAIERVFDAAQRLNGMGLEKEAIAEAFTDAQSEGSPSG